MTLSNKWMLVEYTDPNRKDRGKIIHGIFETRMEACIKISHVLKKYNLTLEETIPFVRDLTISGRSNRETSNGRVSVFIHHVDTNHLFNKFLKELLDSYTVLPLDVIKRNIETHPDTCKFVFKPPHNSPVVWKWRSNISF